MTRFTMDIAQTPSPNFDDRVNPDSSQQAVDVLIMHYTGMKTGAEALARMCEPEAKVSAHYMVEEDGCIFQLVDEDKRAWHAGVASWRGHTNINARSIGIEIVNPGHEWGYRAFPQAQIDSVIALSKAILSRHDIPARNIVGHSDVAPMRKQDPGELFPWKLLAEEGIGVWHNISNEEELRSADRAFSARDRLGATTMLATFGYGISDSPNSEETSAIIAAFQRHFRPVQVNGVWDKECQDILEYLARET